MRLGFVEIWTTLLMKQKPVQNQSRSNVGDDADHVLSCAEVDELDKPIHVFNDRPTEVSNVRE